MVVTNAPRHEKAALGTRVSSGQLPLYLLTPEQHTHAAGGHRFATVVKNDLVLIGSKPIKTQAEGLKSAPINWGQTASSFPPPVVVEEPVVVEVPVIIEEPIVVESVKVPAEVQPVIEAPEEPVGELRVLKTDNGTFQLVFLSEGKESIASEEFDKQKDAVEYGLTTYQVKAKRLLRKAA